MSGRGLFAGNGLYREFRHIGSWFLVTRFALTVIGALSLTTLGRMTSYLILDWDHPRYPWMDVWGQWDTGWYLDIAGNGYSPAARMLGYANYVFFPFYPLLVRLAGSLTQHLHVKSYLFVGGALVSNLSLLASAFLLHRLARLDYDEATAARSVKYLFLWPVSFILSGILSESLFLALILGCFLSARTGRWLAAGLCGFLASLTRNLGVWAFLPVLYLYLREKGFKPRNIRPDIAFLFLIPLGLFVFAAYNYRLTGDPLAFISAQAAWGRAFGNPVRTLLDGLFGGAMIDIHYRFSAWWLLIVLAGLAAFIRWIPFAYWLLSVLFLLVPLLTGLQSMPRYTVVVFPLFMLLGRIGRNAAADQWVTIALAILQGCLMVFWSIGFALII